MSVRTVVLPLALAAVCAAGVTGCRRAAPAADDLDDPKVATFGAAPAPAPSVHLQPDVVIVKGGAHAIRAASADGLTWTIDGSAVGASDLAVGRVMFMTSRAVGRVARIERRGGDIVATLVPVRLTEVIKDANIRIDQEIQPASVTYQQGIEGEGSVRQLAEMDTPRLVPASWAHLVSDTSNDMPEARKLSYKAKVGRFEVEPYLNMSSQGSKQLNRVGFKVAVGTSTRYDTQLGSASRGFKLGADVSLYGQKLTVHAVMPISNGTMGSGTTFLINGIERMDVGLFGGAENGLGDNVKVRVEVPVEVLVPIPREATEGIPFAVHVKIKFLVDTAFTSKNGNIAGHGQYSLKGPMGLESGHVVVPAFETAEPMMKSIEGVNIGVTGFVFAYEYRFLVGFGTADWQAGPYFKFIGSFGISRGSALTWANCTGLTVKVDVGTGVGLQVSTPVQNILKKILPDVLLGKDAKTKLEFEVLETMKTIVNNTVVQPNIPMCQTG